ncbi:MAG TPA: dihydrodipicolinate synthase family protein [Chthonomonadaceae bacterium]|nr:dihydrodipicolinate synthase family protein [Chthonomonadaceae bacterium]
MSSIIAPAPDTQRPTPLPFLQGVIAPMLTPVHADGSLDLAGAAALVNWLVERKYVRTVFARSGMGKMFTFTVAETRQFAEAVIQAAEGRIGVIVGASGEWLTRAQDRTQKPEAERYLAQAVELTRYVQRLGADGAVHVMPEAYTPAPGEPVSEAMFRYFQTVHDAADIPIVLYQPGGIAPEYCMTPELLRRLLALPRIAGMKVSTRDEAVFAPLAEVVRGTRFALIAGNETYYLRALEQGAVGVIGEGCNTYPEILDAVRVHFRARRLEEAARAQADVQRGLALKEGLDGAVVWKQVFMRRGVRIEPYDRSGTPPYPPETVEKVEAALRALLAPYSS